MDNIVNFLKIKNSILQKENENLKDEVQRLKIIVEQIFKLRTDTNFLNNKNKIIDLDF